MKNMGVEHVATTSEPLLPENVQKLRAIFPQFVKDGEIDFEALKAFFDAEHAVAGPEKYGLSWAGKSDAFRAIRMPATGTLSPQKDESKEWDTTQNLFLEGDNLEVLKLLQRHYRSKIKMIYIDPPYNTGKDFVYKDNFTESVADYYERTGQAQGGIKLTANTEKNGRFHSDWLTMMYPRLFLAKNLLKEDGVIFVSIDDNEVANLRLIMDEIFGEENYLNAFCWLNNLKGRQISGVGAAKTYEHILCYARNVQNITVFEGRIEALKTLMPSAYKGFDYEIEEDATSAFVVKNELYNTNSAFNEETRPTLIFNIHYNFETNEVRITDITDGSLFAGFTKIEPRKNNDGIHKYHAWRWGRDKIEHEFKDLKFVKTTDGAKIYTKVRSHDMTTLKDIFPDISSMQGTNEVKRLFNNQKFFDYPKPVDLIRILIAQSDDNDIILDFFAGSGTTAHAVMELNALDNGNRKWICVQLPEETEEGSEAHKAGYNTIADISRERIRRAGAKIAKGDIGFKSFKLQKSNHSVWHNLTEADDEAKLKEQSKIFVDHPLVAGYNEKSVVYEILLKEGFDLNAKVEESKIGNIKVWEVFADDRKMFVTFAPTLTRIQLDTLHLAKENTLVCLDSALDDSLKLNLSRNVMLRTI